MRPRLFTALAAVCLTALLTASAFADTLTLRVEKSARPQMVQVELNGQTIARYICSTGKERRVFPKCGSAYVANTPEGAYPVLRITRRHWSRAWQVPMRYAVFFTSGKAIHATLPEHYDALGRPDSGGCVRLKLADAATVYRLVKRVGIHDTSIVIQ